MKGLGSRILIIENEPEMLNSLVDMVKSFTGKNNMKFLVSTARDGEEGLQLATVGNFDVILSDIRLPKLDGMQVLLETRKMFPEKPFIMLSGYLGSVEVPENINRVLFLNKPFKPVELEKAISMWV